MFQHISKISITRLSNIHRLARTGTELDELQTVKPLQELPFKSGTARWTVATKQTAAGTQYDFTLSFTAAKTIRWGGIPFILVLELCDGEKKIIGSPYLPVFVESTETQENESITIKHINNTFPRNVSSSVI